jgi:hypothetical protein
VVLVRERDVDPAAVVGRAPFEAALITARTDQRVPDERSGLRVEDDVNATLLPDADDGALALATADLKDVCSGACGVR